MPTLSQEWMSISIHALREEGDPSGSQGYRRPLEFQSTPSARRATWVRYTPASSALISIHALREEGDRQSVHSKTLATIFQSTPSARRATDYDDLKAQNADLFQSTPSARRATPVSAVDYDRFAISIHALREEGDVRPFLHECIITPYFNPRPPRGGRHSVGNIPRKRFDISIHALREEGDIRATDKTPGYGQFQSTPSARRATLRFCQRAGHGCISIHALREEGDQAK